MKSKLFVRSNGKPAKAGLIASGLCGMLSISNSVHADGANQRAVSQAISNCNSAIAGSGTPLVYQGETLSVQYNSVSTNSVCSLAGSLTASSVQSLTPDQIFGMGYSATRTNGGVGSKPYDYFRLRNSDMKGGGAGDEDFSPLSFWAKTDNDFGAVDTTLNSTGYKFDNHQFVFGGDYRIQDNWVAGGAFTYLYNNATYNSGRGGTTTNDYSGSLYTTYHITDELHVEATAAYGGFDYTTNRSITLAGLGTTVATGTPSGNQYTFSWGGGYDFNYQGYTLAPYLRGDYMNMSIGGYGETGSIAAVNFGSQNIESMVSSLGMQTSKVINLPWGVLIPQLRGEWHHQYMDNQRSVRASFVTDPTGQVFTLNSNAPSRDYFTVGAELSTVLPGGVSAFLAYETLQGYTSVNSNKLMLGGRLEF